MHLASLSLLTNIPAKFLGLLEMLGPHVIVYCWLETNNNNDSSRLHCNGTRTAHDVPPNVDDGGSKDYELNGFMIIAALACVFTVFVVTVIVYYIYFRLYSNRLQQLELLPRRRIRISHARRDSWWANEFLKSPRENGLCSEEMEALPVFVYKPHESFNEGLRCSVCLCDFQEGEKAKLLPNCNHSFHVDCIDMWFSSHSNCPLCRASVGVQPKEPADSDGGHVEITVREDGQVDSKGSPGEKSSRSSASGSAGSEPRNEGLEQKDNGDESKEVEETSKADVAIDIPTLEK